jgi:hypothetical protein
VAQKDYDVAISLYRRILVREPNAERVRLDLARAFFLKGDYDNAERQFRFARAGDIDDTVKANVDHFLSEINRLREWTVNFALALAPDTNQNAATSANQVNIFGLPFALDKAARKQSGIGVAGYIGGEWSPLLADNVKARIGGNFARVDYSGGKFDDMIRCRLRRTAIPVCKLGFQRTGQRIRALVRQRRLYEGHRRQTGGRLWHHFKLVVERIRQVANPSRTISSMNRVGRYGRSRRR